MLSPEQRRLVEANMGLARHIAWRFIRKGGRTPAADQADILGMAYVGLCEAAHRFDPSRGCRFSSYAFSFIWGAVAKYLKQAGTAGGIKVSSRLPVEARPSVASLDAPAPGTDNLNLGDTIPSTMSVEDAAIERVALSSMPEELRTIFQLRQAGLTQTGS